VGGLQKKVKIGRYPEMSLMEARLEVLQLKITIRRGENPFPQAEGEVAPAGITMRDLCILYLKACLPVAGKKGNRPATLEKKLGQLGLKFAADGSLIDRSGQGDVIRAWGTRPAGEITAEDVRTLIEEVSVRGVPTSNLLLDTLAAMFKWAVPRHLSSSPCVGIRKVPTMMKPGRILITPIEDGTVSLAREELAIVWEAAGNLGGGPAAVYNPERDCIRMLILTGQRVSIIQTAELRDFDLERKLWTIRAEQEGTKGISNLVPITPEIEAIVRSCPHASGFLFSKKGGTKQIAISVLVKLHLDAAIKARGWKLPPFRLHDLRHTMRTGLSSLPVPKGDVVNELIIGHVLPGMRGRYDHWKYLAEKRVALELWAAKVRDMVTSPRQTAAGAHGVENIAA